MLEDVGVELVTRQPFTPGANSVDLLVNNPSATTLPNANLFLEFINTRGTVVLQIPTQVTCRRGRPTCRSISTATASTRPTTPSKDYIVLAFLTDYEGNILDTGGRPLSSFQVDPLPKLAVDAAP